MGAKSSDHQIATGKLNAMNAMRKSGSTIALERWAEKLDLQCRRHSRYGYNQQGHGEPGTGNALRVYKRCCTSLVSSMTL